MIVAIDGGVASGKSAVGRRVAAKLGIPFVDSGLMYRAMARLVVERGIDPNSAETVSAIAESSDVQVQGGRVSVNGVDVTEGIYDLAYADALPVISSTAGVRLALVAQQRDIGRSGVVMAGRDIGTVVFPDADHKFFLVASLDEKVRRRAAQFERRGEPVDEAAMRQEVEARDRADTERSVAPLRAAEDAEVIDTDRLGLDQVVDVIIDHIRAHPRSA
jgi:cytidylate kinase